MKKMKEPRGTARQVRRELAKAYAAGAGLNQRYFKRFWSLGANEAALKAALKEEAQAGIAVAQGRTS